MSKGYKYDGNWDSGTRHGHGKEYFSDGTLWYEGEWENNWHHGEGTKYNYNPKPLEGTYNWVHFGNYEDYYSKYVGGFE